MMFCALVLLPLAFACGPGTGKITDRPQLTFNYSSPLGWTYPSTGAASGGQSLNPTMAQNRISTDIENAVIRAVESYGYSTAGVRVDNAVAPDPVEITNPTTSPCEVSKYGVEDGAVTKKCSATTAGEFTLYSHLSTITVTSPVALAESNWENIATKVWASLTANAGVKFHGLITVKA